MHEVDDVLLVHCKLSHCLHVANEHWDTSYESDPGSWLVDLPHIKPLILVKTLVKLVWRVSLGKDALPCLVKPHHVRVSHLPKDAVDGVNRFGAPTIENKRTLKVWTPDIRPPWLSELTFNEIHRIFSAHFMEPAFPSNERLYTQFHHLCKS